MDKQYKEEEDKLFREQAGIIAQRLEKENHVLYVEV